MSSRGLNIYRKWFRLITYHFGCSFPESSKISVQGGDLSLFMLHWTHVDGCEVLPHHIQVIVECTESILLQQVPFCICVHIYFLLHWAEYVHIHSTTSVAASFIKPNLMYCLHIPSLSLRHRHTHTRTHNLVGGKVCRDDKTCHNISVSGSKSCQTTLLWDCVKC